MTHGGVSEVMVIVFRPGHGEWLMPKTMANANGEKKKEKKRRKRKGKEEMKERRKKGKRRNGRKRGGKWRN